MEILMQVLSAILVIGSLVLVVWALRRGGFWRLRVAGRKHRQARQLESLERLSLSPHHTLHLVRVGGGNILVALYSGGCTLLEVQPSTDRSYPLAERVAVGDRR